MALSKIKITFNEDLAIGDTITIDLANDNFPTLIIPLNEQWVNFRSSSNQVTIGTPTSTQGERSAINYVTSFSLDFGLTGFNITRDVNVVTIICPAYYLSFENPTSNNNSVDFEITNFEGTVLEITDLQIVEATNPCTHYGVSATTNILAETINHSIGVTVENNTDNPFYFEVLRGQGYLLNMNSNDGQGVFSGMSPNQAPKILNPNSFNIQINNSPNGATVIVSNTLTGLYNDFEYSLDNSTWQSDNVFTGLGADSYTLYIRDELGCSINIDFSITSLGLDNAFFLISKTNSIRFANRVAWGDCSNYKTDENSLSYEADVKLPYKEVLLFQSCDVITTQFKSNYSDISATIIKSDNTEIPLIVEQKTNFLGLKDRRDAVIYDLGNNKIGVYFTSGNLYDYDYQADTGNDYVLNGLLPEWGKVGNYINIDNAYYFIQEIIEDEDRNAKVLVIDVGSLDTPNQDEVTVVSCLYNRFNYNIYEFTIDMVNYLNECFQVRINNNDDNFDNLIHLSEWINVKIKQENTVEIEYKNSSNTDIYYPTGIKHKMRLKYEYVNGKVDDPNELYKTDDSGVLLESNVYELDEFIFFPMTKQRMRQLVLALSHDIIEINNVSYLKNGNIEVGEPLKETNRYEVKAVLIKIDDIFNSQSEGDNSFNETSIEIPGLVDYGGGFVRY